MAKLLGVRIKNYRALADFRLGQVKYGQGEPLPRLACLIGPNGSGKSTVLDAFGFVADCLLEGVEAACDKAHRGGFERLRTQGMAGAIQFEIFFEADDPERPIVYELSVDLVDEVPSVVKETLRQRQEGETVGKPYYFLKLEKGRGTVWTGQAVEGRAKREDKQKIVLAQLDKLGIATLGNLAEHPRIVTLRNYIEHWYLSYFVPEAARVLPAAGAQPALDREGSNIGNVLQYYQRQHPRQFTAILSRLANAIPGLRKITPEITKDKRLLLKFDERGYTDPFYQHSMSDGTLKMLAYAVLLEDPSPRPFIGIEEPENGLYVRLVERLAGQFSSRAAREEPATQILVTTHSPYFVDALTPEQVWLVRKGDDGHATVQRAADNKTVREMSQQGIPLGSLWYSNHFDDGAPA
jgi:predicted ATPase